MDTDQNYGIKKEKENSEDGLKTFDLCTNPHNFSGNCYFSKFFFVLFLFYFHFRSESVET